MDVVDYQSRYGAEEYSLRDFEGNSKDACFLHQVLEKI